MRELIAAMQPPVRGRARTKTGAGRLVERRSRGPIYASLGLLAMTGAAITAWQWPHHAKDQPPPPIVAQKRSYRPPGRTGRCRERRGHRRARCRGRHRGTAAAAQAGRGGRSADPAQADPAEVDDSTDDGAGHHPKDDLRARVAVDRGAEASLAQR